MSEARDTAARVTQGPGSPADAERYKAFGAELEALRRRIFSELGAADVTWVRRVSLASRAAEVLGRLLLQFGLGPLTFVSGIFFLWLRKQLHMFPIGHPALHGSYDALPGGEAFAAKSFRWDTPIDEASWRYGHNVRHHGATNVAGKDPDLHFGPVRFTYQSAFHPVYPFQFLHVLFTMLPGFVFWMGAHVSGVLDLACVNGSPTKYDFLPDRSWSSAGLAARRSLRKWVPYYAWNFGFFPALAGASWRRVLLANVLAELACNLYSGLTILCGHVGEEVKSFPLGTKPASHGEWCVMQVEASNNFQTYRVLSFLCGGLDYQIEHHLFPTLPVPRLWQIAPEVRAICERHGVPYRTGPWRVMLLSAAKQIYRMSWPGGDRELYAPLKTNLPQSNAG